MDPIYVLADLPYDYDALDPVIIPRILELHHGTHHRSYVTNANALTERIASLAPGDDPSALLRALSFNVSGHRLHELFWESMSPSSSQAGPLCSEELARSFGSIDAAKSLLTRSVARLAGSGWGVLSWDPMARRVLVSQVHDHQHDAVLGAIPILAIDGWEHAYYLQYESDRAGWAKAFWDVCNWSGVEERLRVAMGATTTG